ncbi:MAG TPA: Uma2 family endonuclease [Hymenobacter sp.]|uniref:Uma2 family endonuclease n=1 Tax=Hymenobacter sp. TaxID=1898978 RepID=UPI002D7E8199|nr:Uma2 family endonuclease [Hymenobacter sp.]HET9505066.1 Uma2 family endonuclease [Hymenobacter sp.]
MDFLCRLPHFYTLSAFWALEAASERRHEYLDGSVVVTEPDALSHNLLKGNLVDALRRVVRPWGGQVFSTSIQLEAQANRCYLYPDIIVTSDPADRLDPAVVRYPVFVSEISSPTTAEYDRTEKGIRYQRIASLRHYLLISQVAWTVEWFRRDEAGQWIYTLLTGPAATLEIPDMGLVLPLRELYEDTDVAPLLVMPGAGESELGRF